MKLKKTFLIFMTVFIVFMLSSCSGESPKQLPEGISSEFYDEAISIVNMLDKKMRDIEELTDKEKQKVTLFVYNDEGTIEELVLRTDIGALHSHYFTNVYNHENNDIDLNVSAAEAYNKTLLKIKTELNIE